MTIAVGETLPSANLLQATGDGPRPVATDDFFAGKKVVLFAVPGAFTPTCTVNHLPGFVDHAEAIKAKGVDVIACRRDADRENGAAGGNRRNDRFPPVGSVPVRQWRDLRH